MGIFWVVVGGGKFIVGSGGCCWVMVGLIWVVVRSGRFLLSGFGWWWIVLG